MPTPLPPKGIRVPERGAGLTYQTGIHNCLCCMPQVACMSPPPPSRKPCEVSASIQCHAFHVGLITPEAPGSATLCRRGRARGRRSCRTMQRPRIGSSRPGRCLHFCNCARWSSKHPSELRAECIRKRDCVSRTTSSWVSQACHMRGKSCLRSPMKQGCGFGCAAAVAPNPCRTKKPHRRERSLSDLSALPLPAPVHPCSTLKPPALP